MTQPMTTNEIKNQIDKEETLLTDEQLKELNDELDTQLQKEIAESQGEQAEASDTEIPPKEAELAAESSDVSISEGSEPSYNSVIIPEENTEVVTQSIEDDRMAEALAAQTSTMRLPPGVSYDPHNRSIVRPKSRYIKVPKEDEKAVRDLLDKKNALKPIMAVVPVQVTPPIASPVTMPANPEYQVFNEVIPVEQVVNEEAPVIQNKRAIEQFALNMFHVMQQGSQLPPGVWVAITNPWFGPVSPDQAINLAVWLVRYAMKSGATITFGELMQTVDEAVAKGKIIER